MRSFFSRGDAAAVAISVPGRPRAAIVARWVVAVLRDFILWCIVTATRMIGGCGETMVDGCSGIDAATVGFINLCLVGFINFPLPFAAVSKLDVSLHIYIGTILRATHHC